MSEPTGTEGKILLYQNDGVTLIATINDETGAIANGQVDPDLERIYVCEPILFPQPGDDAGGVNIQISVDDTITVSGNSMLGIGSGSMIKAVFDFFKYSPDAENGAWLCIGTKLVHPVQPKQLRYRSEAGKKDLTEFSFVFNITKAV